MLVAPDGLTQRQVDDGGRTRHPAPLVRQQQLYALDGELPRAQPARHLLQQAARTEQQGVGVLDAVEQFQAGAKRGRRLNPDEQFRAVAMRVVEHLQHGGAAAALQAGPGQVAQLPQSAAADALQPVEPGTRGRQQGARQAVEAAHQTVHAQHAAPARAGARQQPGAARRGGTRQLGRIAQRAQAGRNLPAQGAHAAEQAQAGARIDQQGRFFALRHQRRVLQQRQRHRLQGLRFQFGRAFVQARLRRQHQRASAAHARPDAGRPRQRRQGHHLLLLQHHAQLVSRPARAKHFEREPGQTQADPESHGVAIMKEVAGAGTGARRAAVPCA